MKFRMGTLAIRTKVRYPYNLPKLPKPLCISLTTTIYIKKN